MVYSFQGVIPVIHETAYIHPESSVIGKVTIGAKVFVGAGAVLRGDIGEIILKDGCNVQENCTVHMFPGVTVIIEESAHVGHGAVIHGAHLGRNCLIGMNAVIMDEVMIGAESIVGALSFVKSGTKIPERSLVVGNPAKIIRQVSDEMIHWKTKGTELYQSFPKEYEASCSPSTPLTDNNDQLDLPEMDYSIWKKD